MHNIYKICNACIMFIFLTLLYNTNKLIHHYSIDTAKYICKLTPVKNYFINMENYT